MNRLGTVAQLFVLMVGVLLPALAWRSRSRFQPDAPGPTITRRQYYTSAFFTQFATLFLALLVARDVGMELLGEFRVEPLVWLATAVVFGAILATLPARWRSRGPGSRKRHAVIAPRTAPQAAVNAALCIVAGIGEEITWRRVLHECVWWATGSWWIATIFCSLSFGVAHAIQGPRSMLIIAGVAFWMHLTVLWTGSLHLAMVVHAVYDLIATFTMAKWVRREETEAASGPVPPPAV